MNLKYVVKAQRQLQRLPAYDQDVVLSMIEEILIDPTSGESIRGSRTLYRSRKGDYRVIYRHSGSSLKIVLIEKRSPHTYHRVNPKRLPSPDIIN